MVQYKITKIEGSFTPSQPPLVQPLNIFVFRIMVPVMVCVILQVIGGVSVERDSWLSWNLVVECYEVVLLVFVTMNSTCLLASSVDTTWMQPKHSGDGTYQICLILLSDKIPLSFGYSASRTWFIDTRRVYVNHFAAWNFTLTLFGLSVLLVK